MSKKLLKITTNTWENESRDIRELNVVKEFGADVLIMAKGETTGEVDIVKGFKVYRMSTKPLGEKFPSSINRIVSLFTWAHQARKFKPDIISGHDLLPLFIGWMSTCFIRKSQKPKLVYDSHEFTIYAGDKSKINELVTKYLERFLIKKCVFTIEVNDSIANAVQKIHKLKERPVVVRNIPERWVINSEICAQTRKALLEKFEGGNDLILLSYHGGLIPNRGIEELILLAAGNSNLRVLILGNGTEKYVEELHNKVEELSLYDRVIFHEAVPQNEIWKYVGAVDIGMILAPATCKNHLYSLPNKFFENIQAEVPIVCPEYPAMAEIVQKYKIGITCDPKNSVSIDKAIEQLFCNKDIYDEYKRNTKHAKEELCWEKEKKVLVQAYANLLLD